MHTYISAGQVIIPHEEITRLVQGNAQHMSVSGSGMNIKRKEKKNKITVIIISSYMYIVKEGPTDPGDTFPIQPCIDPWFANPNSRPPELRRAVKSKYAWHADFHVRSSPGGGRGPVELTVDPWPLVTPWTQLITDVCRNDLMGLGKGLHGRRVIDLICGNRFLYNADKIM